MSAVKSVIKGLYFEFTYVKIKEIEELLHTFWEPLQTLSHRY